MRILISKLVGRSTPPRPRPRPPALLHLLSNYFSSSSSPHFLFTISIHQHHRQDDCSSTLHPLSQRNCFSLSRRFSTQPDFSQSSGAFLPVRALISVLDSYHDFTGLPWWIIISSATLATRLALFPLIVLQRKKMKRIGELLPKLPPPFPPPLSGRSFRDQFSLFWKEKQSSGCPSFIWFFSSFAVQVPCFLLWIMSVRRMSLCHHPGFDCGGTLWFQNLTEYPHGVFGPIFPLFIAGLHFTNVQAHLGHSVTRQVHHAKTRISITIHSSVCVPFHPQFLDIGQFYPGCISTDLGLSLGLGGLDGSLEIDTQTLFNVSLVLFSYYGDYGNYGRSTSYIELLMQEEVVDPQREERFRRQRNPPCCGTGGHSMLLRFKLLMSFKPSLQQLPGSLGSLAKCYKIYMQLLTLPILFTAFNVPQGSLVYWLTNSSLTLIQQVCLSHPGLLEYLGLVGKNASTVAPANKARANSGVADIFVTAKQGKISAQSLSPGELVSFSIKVLSDGFVDTALKLLRLALEKDPGHARALFIMGQTLLQKKQFAEATECLESAVSKLTVVGHPTEVEEVDLLILSSLWAGIANVKQGKMEQGLLHLQRIAQLEEPEDSKSKAHYYDLLFILSSVLLNMERKTEASKYLHKAAAYDRSYSVFLKDLENIPHDVASTRRDV